MFRKKTFHVKPLGYKIAKINVYFENESIKKTNFFQLIRKTFSVTMRVKFNTYKNI